MQNYIEYCAYCDAIFLFASNVELLIDLKLSHDTDCKEVRGGAGTNIHSRIVFGKGRGNDIILNWIVYTTVPYTDF